MKRESTIDIMKGIGILLVVLGHTYYNSQIIYSFHMPLFFILSGASMVFSTHKYSWKRRFRLIMIPYFCFSLLSFIYWLLIESHFRPINNTSLFVDRFLGTFDIRLQQFLNIFIAENTINYFAYNIVLWFLPCLFVADYIYSRIKITPPLVKWAIIACIPIVYDIFSNIPCLPFCSNIAIIAVPFWALGHRFYIPLKTSIKLSIGKNITIFLILLTVLIFAYRYFYPQIDMLGNKVFPLYLFYGFAIIGTILVLSASSILEKSKYLSMLFCWIGRNSLVIMCIHEPLKRVLLYILSKASGLPIDVIRDDLSLSILTTLVIVAFCIPFINLINKYTPWILGRWQSKKNKSIIKIIL